MTDKLTKVFTFDLEREDSNRNYEIRWSLNTGMVEVFK